MRGTSHQFKKLVEIVGPSISKLEMNWREAVSLGKQLGITLSQVLLFNCENILKLFKIDFLL